jgi:hypothetical protein
VDIVGDLSRLAAFMATINAMHTPSTGNNRYRSLQRFFKWLTT